METYNIGQTSKKADVESRLRSDNYALTQHNPSFLALSVPRFSR